MDYAFSEIYNAQLDIYINNQVQDINIKKCVVCNAKINSDYLFCGRIECKTEYFKNKYKLKNELGKRKGVIHN